MGEGVSAYPRPHRALESTAFSLENRGLLGLDNEFYLCYNEVMIGLEIEGKGGLTHSQTQDLLEWLSVRLGFGLYKTVVDIDFYYVKGLLKNENTYARVWSDDDNVRSREFTLEVDANLSSETAGISICHECVHVKDIASGRWRQPMGHIQYYNRKKYNINRIPYCKRPWEIEALKHESLLWEEFCHDSEMAEKVRTYFYE